MRELKIAMLFQDKYLIQDMKKILLFLSLFLISSCKIDNIDTEVEVWEIAEEEEGDWRDKAYTPEPEEKFQFIIFDIKVDYEELKDANIPSLLQFKDENYCYADSKKESDANQEDLTKESNTELDQKQTEEDITNSHLTESEDLAEEVGWSLERRYRWIHFKDQSFTADESELYFILFRIYDKSGQLISKKRIYYDHYNPEVFLPYSENIHSIKAFVMENSTGREIKKIGETSVFPFKKIKEFSNEHTANCHVIEKS